MTYLTDSNLCDASYFPSLSSMEITITNKEIINELIELLFQKKLLVQKMKSILLQSFSESPSQENKIKYSYLEYTPVEQIPGLKIIIKNLSSFIIEYYENRPPHLRELFIKHIHQILSKHLPPLLKCSISQLSSNSWFSVLWSPTKSSSVNYMTTSFISYYQFKFSEESLNKQSLYGEIPIIGILPIKFIHKYFLERISKNYIGKVYDPLILKSSLENVNTIVLNNANRTSLDVEYYLKNCPQTPIINNMI